MARHAVASERTSCQMVALLRGINVGGNRKIPMASLCLAVEKAGFQDAQTYIQSGNLVFSAGRMSELEAASNLEAVIAESFGFAVDVIVRSAGQWRDYARRPPFPDAAKDRPNLLMLGLAKLPLASEAVAQLKAKAVDGERIKRVGDALWIDFVAGSGRSKISPALLCRATGSPVTLRNWNTVKMLEQMLAGSPTANRPAKRPSSKF